MVSAPQREERSASKKSRAQLLVIGLASALALVSAMAYVWYQTGAEGPTIGSIPFRCRPFPLSPPQPSASEVIPRSLLLAADATDSSVPLLKVWDRIRFALAKAGYSDQRFYCLVEQAGGPPVGYVIGSRLEKINEDGTPRPSPDRWSADLSYDSLFEALIGRLVLPAKGYFRLLFFVVTDRAVAPSDYSSKAEMEKLFESGQSSPPQEISQQTFGPASNVVVLIYEFEQKANQPAPVIVPGKHTGAEHMMRSGLVAALSSSR